MNWASFLLMPVFYVIWTGVVGTFDVVIGHNIYRQLRSEQFAVTTGVVTAGSVTRAQGAKGGSVYSPDLRYAYAVGEQSFEGRAYRYDAMGSSDSAWAKKAVADHPVGAATTVHYDPRNPADAVLSTGINGSDLFMLLFITPFNLVLIAIWWAAAEWGLRKIRGAPEPEAGGARWSSDGARTRVCLDPLSALACGVIASGFAAFVSIFIVGFSSGFHPGMRFILVIWIMVIALGLFAAWRQAQALRAGDRDLVIDPLARTVDLPCTMGRKLRQKIPSPQIADVVVEAQERSGPRGSVKIVHMVSLKRRDGRQDLLVEWQDETRAKALAAWLRAKIGLALR